MTLRAIVAIAGIIAMPWSTSAADGYRDKLYIAGSGADAVYVIDVPSHKIIKTLNLGKQPHGFAATADGKTLWVATLGDGGIVKVDTTRDEVLETHDLGDVTDEIEITDDGKFVYVPMYMNACYYVFDTEQKKVVAKIPTDGNPHNVVKADSTDRYFYLAPLGNSLEPGPGHPGMNAAPKRFGVPLLDCDGKPKPPVPNHQIYVVDTQTHKTVGTIPLGSAPRPIAVTNDGKWLYANVDNFLGVVAVDLEKREEVYRVKYPLRTEEHKLSASRPHGIWVLPNQKEVWSTSVNHGMVYAYDRTQDLIRLVADIPVGRGPYWLTFSSDSKYGYTSNQTDSTVSVIDVATHKEVTRVALPPRSSPHTNLVVKVPTSGPAAN